MILSVLLVQMFLTTLDIDTLSRFLAHLDTIESVDWGRLFFLLIPQNAVDICLSIQVGQFEVVEATPVMVNHLIASDTQFQSTIRYHTFQCIMIEVMGIECRIRLCHIVWIGIRRNCIDIRIIKRAYRLLLIVGIEKGIDGL